MTIRNVAVVGTGVLGCQIAFQSAFKGLAVTAYDVDAAALDDARRRLDTLVRTYLAEVPGAGDDHAATAARDRLTLTDDPAAAVAGADLIIEAVAEDLEIKRETFRKLAPLAPAATIFATSASTFPPSDLAESTGRPGRFLALHFLNRIWRHNTAEIMGTPETDPAVFAAVVDFAKTIGMVPIELHREKAGYVLDSLLVPFLRAAVDLVAGGYAQPAAVDKAWRIATGAPTGPFQMIDDIGLSAPHRVLAHGDAADRELAGWLKRNYIDKGRLGVATGEGFYKYL